MGEANIGSGEPSRALLFLKTVRAPMKLAPNGSMRMMLAGVEEGRRFETVLAAVEASAVEVLGRGRRAPLNPGSSLTDLGFDSLEALELRRDLWLNTGVEVPVERILGRPTLRELSEYLLSVEPLTPPLPGHS